jgi:rubrerythrin
MQVIALSVSTVFTTSRDDQPPRIQQTQEEASMRGRRPTALIVAMAGIALLTLNSAIAKEKIQPHTRQDLKAAMQNEALTVLKYTAFAQHARKEGKIALAEILEQTAKSEQRHFSEAARMCGLVREDWHNLANAIVGEYAEFSQTYTQMAERAEAAGDKEVAKSFREIAAEEAKHHRDFQAAVSKSLKPE